MTKFILIRDEKAVNRPMEKTERRLQQLISLSYLLFIVAAAVFAHQQLPQVSIPMLILLAVLALIIGELAIFKLPKAIVFYIFFGVLTTLVAQLSFNGTNWLISGSLSGKGGFWWLIPQTVSWILAVFFAFITNRYFVFNAEQGQFWPELRRFFIARLGSGIFVEYLGMLILVNLIAMPESWAKLLTSIIVVIVNYVVSKLFVFRKNSQAAVPGTSKQVKEK